VRRANSAKVTTTTAKTQRIDSKGSITKTAIAKRSLSQPTDLDVIECENNMMNNLDNIKHIDDDASDTDSLSSNHVDEIDDDGQRSVVYAEVLYKFQAGGPQELSLEKGILVEVIKRESGPWWWGRIKYDAVVDDNEIEALQGWFPKDFVKVIPSYGTNRKTSIHQSFIDCDIHLPPSSAAPTISSSQSSSEIMRDNVIKELLETEINYVKLLNSLVNG
jgi:Rho guanine nucleotide exchange factor 4/29